MKPAGPGPLPSLSTPLSRQAPQSPLLPFPTVATLRTPSQRSEGQRKLQRSHTSLREAAVPLLGGSGGEWQGVGRPRRTGAASGGGWAEALGGPDSVTGPTAVSAECAPTERSGPLQTANLRARHRGYWPHRTGENSEARARPRPRGRGSTEVTQPRNA